MKIESIVLENFGLYGCKRFAFDGQPLVLIYGPNESGKTTALNGLRQALFGFPHNSAYLTGSPMSADVTVSLSDNRMVRFTRQKKRADSFSATVDNKFPLSELQWQELASGLDLKSYQSLFGFSLEELRSGEKALAHAPLNEALSGSGFGGLARLQSVQSRLDEFLSATLKRNGTGGAINAKLAEIETAERQLEAVLTLPADVAVLRNQLSEANDTASQLATNLAALRLELERCQRLQAALPRAVEYRQVEESLKSYEIPDAIDEEYRLQWTLTQNRLAGARTEVIAEQKKLAKLEATLAALPPEQYRLVDDTTIRQLGSQAKTIEQLRSEQTQVVRQFVELEEKIHELITHLDWPSNEIDHSWRHLQIEPYRRAEIEQALKSAAVIKSELAQCHTRREAAQEQLRIYSNASPSTEFPTNLPDLESILVELERLSQNCDRLRIRLGELQRDAATGARKERLLRLAHNFAPNESGLFAWDGQLSTSWQMPERDAIARHHHRELELTAQLTNCNRELDTLRQQLAQQQLQIDRAKTAQGAQSLEQVHVLWQQRDDLIRQWLDKLNEANSHAVPNGAEQQERLKQIVLSNGQADSAVRMLLETADQVAAVITAQKLYQELQRRYDQVKQQIEDGQAHSQTVRAAWSELWIGCPFLPATVKQANEWLDDFHAWNESYNGREQVAREFTAAMTLRDDCLQKLMLLWPADRAPCDDIAEVRQQIASWRSASAAKAAQSRILTDLTATLVAAETESNLLQEQLAASQQHLHGLLESVGIPTQWLPDNVLSKLDLLSHLCGEAGRLDKLQTRSDTITQQINQYAQAVWDFSANLVAPDQAPDQPSSAMDVPPERMALRWLDELIRNDEIESQRRQTATSIATQQASLVRRQGQVEQFEQTLLQLVATAGAQRSEDVQNWIGIANTVFQLRARRAQLTAALQANAPGVPLADFLHELSVLNPRSITAAAASLMAQVASAEAARRSALEQLGAVTRELEFKEQGSAAMECDQRLKRLRCELVELSEQWVVHRLASELLQRTVDRFTRDHEPQLIKHTRRFFSELTDDRYSVVEHDSGKHGGFAVRDNHGHAWQPDKLSTGTREQLYLAIRLAFVTHFNEHHEPLPVIMDDCFVNFDDIRARNALRTLVDWKQSAQTVMLSCHWRSVVALADLAPDTPVITLANGHITPARQLAEGSDDFAGRAPTLHA